MAEKSFEQAITELEQLVSEMEAGSLPVEQMIEKFENGVKLIKLCRGKLDVINRRIEVLTKDDGGAGEWSDFDSDSERARAALKPAAEAPKAAPVTPADDDDLPF